MSLSIGDRFPEVLSAAGQGADWAWAELYRDLAPAVLRFLVSQGAAEPEDCLGECFVQLVRNLPQFRGDEQAFRAWVFQIARHRVVDEWRSTRRRPVTPSAEVAAAQDRVAAAEPADHPVVEQSFIDEVLARLSPDQRAVLTLRVLDGFSVEETGRILQRSAGSVRVLQHRALKTLKRLLTVRVR